MTFPLPSVLHANDDSASTDENTSIGIDVTANDVDRDGTVNKKTVVITKNPKKGSVSVHPRTGVVTYTPDPGTCGRDVFEYTIDDDDGATSGEATVTVEVLCNDPPLAIDDLYSMSEGGTLSIRTPGVLSNDVDTPGSPLMAIQVADVAHGMLSLNPDGSFTYIHDDSETASDVFTYKANDTSKDSNVAAVSIVISPTNDAPAAADDEESTDEDVPVTIDVLANDNDPDGDPLSVDWVSRPATGRVTNNGRDVTYSPDPDFNGTDSFTYTASDGHGGTATATVTVRVIPVNDPPLVQDDSAATREEVPVAIPVLANDTDRDRDTLVVQLVTQPVNGWVDNMGESVTYTPDPDFNGVDTFTYTVSDNNGGTATATVRVTIAPVNDPPMAHDDSAATNEDAPVTIDVLANDSDPEGDSLLIQSVTQPARGSVAKSASNVTYTPNPNFNGGDTFTYTASDNNGGTATATVRVTIAPVNDPPIAQDDSAATDEDAPVTIDVLANDSDPEGDSLLIQSVTQPAHGSVAKSASNVTYTPDPGFNGVDTFTYAVSDGNGGTATATVRVTIAPVNDPPIAQDDSAATDEDTPVTIDVLANDSDPDDDLVAIESVTQPPRGSVVKSASTLTYTPDPGFNGVDTFTYVVSDGNGRTATAMVTVTVAPVNDPPMAQDDSAATDENAPVTIDVLANDSDPEGDSLLVLSVTQPPHGSVVKSTSNVTYTPNLGFNGVDTFTYAASDGNGGTATATVTVAVATVNDPPIAQDDSAATDEDTPVTIDVLANDSDPDGDLVAIASVTQPPHGSVVKSASTLTYTPDPGFNGVDTFTYAVSDGNGGTATAMVTVTVAPVNDPPIAKDDSTNTDEGIPVTIPVLANDSDPDGDALVIESVTKPTNGATVPSGTSIVYTPSPSFDGTDTFTYTVSDGNGGTAMATVSVTVVAANDSPIAQDDRATTNENTPLTIPVLANDSDPDADVLIVESVVKPAANGFVVNNRTDVTYIPDPGFVGIDSFTYKVADGKGRTATARVTVIVNAVNDPPVAQDDAAVTDEGTLVTIPVVANDSDPDGDFLLVESFSQPRHGSVLNSRTGVSYIPDSGFRGVDTFTYTVTDGNGGTATATVTVSVATVNDPPVAQDDNAITDEKIPVVIPVLLNDRDPNADPLAVESVSPVKNGSVQALGTDIKYTPNPGFAGVDEFTYTVSDGKGGTDTATVYVAVVPVNDPPVAQNDSSTTAKNTPITILVLANDSDPDGDSLIVESVGQPLNGTLENNGRDILYTPNDGFTGTDTFTYTVSDGRGRTDTATVTVGVSRRGGAGGAAGEVPCDGKVIISEVAWAGTVADSRDEWIELRNLGTSAVSLDGWVLRWRRTHPTTPDDQIWKVVELSGILAPAPISECDRVLQDIPPRVRIFKENLGDVAWLVSSEVDEIEGGYYTLERRHDATISDVKADLVYDTSPSLNLELSDLGEVIMLVNNLGEVVDTANASYLGRDGWAAGSAATRGTMERIDPLGPDTAENWHTNIGIVTHGADAKTQLLRATPGRSNSPVLEDLDPYAEIEPATFRSGEVLKVDFSLPSRDRRTSGWPWINITRPGFAGLAGGAADFTRYAFSGRYESGDNYLLEIGTTNLAPGSYVFWIIYGKGKAVLVSSVVTP